MRGTAESPLKYGVEDKGVEDSGVSGRSCLIIDRSTPHQGAFIVSGCADGSVLVFDMEKGKAVNKLQGHSWSVLLTVCLIFSCVVEYYTSESFTHYSSPVDPSV